MKRYPQITIRLPVLPNEEMTHEEVLEYERASREFLSEVAEFHGIETHYHKTPKPSPGMMIDMMRCGEIFTVLFGDEDYARALEVLEQYKIENWAASLIASVQRAYQLYSED